MAGFAYRRGITGLAAVPNRSLGGAKVRARLHQGTRNSSRLANLP